MWDGVAAGMSRRRGPVAMLEGKRVAVVVPAHDEEQLIATTLGAIPGFVDRIIVVDDGSARRDRRARARRSATRASSVVAHERNRGVGAAIVTGYKRALEERIDVICVMAARQPDGSRRPRGARRARSRAARSTTRRRTASSPARRGS